MMAPAHETVVDALRVVRAGAALGLTLGEFGARWQGQLKRGQARKRLSGIGQLLGYLGRAGLVQRSSKSPRARFTLTAAGEKMVAEDMAERKRVGR